MVNTQFRSIFLTNPLMISKENIHRSEKYFRLIQTNSISPEYPQIHLSEKEFEMGSKRNEKLGLINPLLYSHLALLQTGLFPIKF